MTNYWLQLVWLFLGGTLLVILIPKREEIVLGEKELRWRPVAAILLIAPYIIWSGFRGNYYGDTGLYRSLFREAPSTFGQIGGYLNIINKDKGFTALTAIIKVIIGNHPVIFFLIIATIQMLCIALVYRRYSDDYWFSIFFFVAATDYMSWMHNGTRQFLAVAIIFAATPLILKRKYIWVILIILFASLFHLSALIMIPILFITAGDAWNWKLWIAILLTVIVLIFINQFTSWLDYLLSDTQYANMVSDWTEWEDNGTNPIRVLVYAIPTILSILGRRWIIEADSPIINLSVGMSLISTLIYIVSIFTSGIFIGRIPIYMSLYSTGILLPWLLNNIFTDRSRSFVKVMAVVLFSLFFYYQMHFTWGLL